MLKLTFHGAVRTVTGSMHLLENGQSRVLLDCGLYQGHRQEAAERNRNIPFEPATVNALLLSHAHIDHSGNIPNLVKKGFEGDIHCTRATADLTAIMLQDSAHIQEKDVEYVNKIRARHGEPPVAPLYTQEDAEKAQDAFVGHALDRWFTPAAGVRAMFRDAGHILGSAIIMVNVSDGDRTVRLCYACDLGRVNLPILRDPFAVEDGDILIIESTYGGRFHGDVKVGEQKLAEVVKRVASQGGKLLIPAFALGRTQELVYGLHRLVLTGCCPDLPIYVDSPLAIDATDIFREHPECFDRETNAFMRRGEDPFGFRQLKYVRDPEESKKLNDEKGPFIIIAASGMVEHGRILHHLKHNIGDRNTTVLLVSWQAEHTLGRRLANGDKVVRIFGEEYERRCQVEVIDEFSAHADHNGLVEWVKKGKNHWKRVFIVHGDEPASLALADALRGAGLADVAVPHMGESVQI
jgi:metallo-beta-lactamase family protein